MTRGEVWLYEHPDRKPRPAPILTRDEHIGRQYDIIAVPSTGAPRGWDTEIELGPEDGMPIECVLNLGNAFSAEKVYFTKYVTTLSSMRMTEVCRMLAYATGC